MHFVEIFATNICVLPFRFQNTIKEQTKRIFSLRPMKGAQSYIFVVPFKQKISHDKKFK
jgi:hypothetical protein